MLPVNISLAAFPAKRHEDAIELAVDLSLKKIAEPAIGKLSIDNVQLVPQSFGIIDEGIVEHLLSKYPETKFRLHANVRVLNGHRLADLSNFKVHQQWFEQAARVSKWLNAPAYTAHSGKRQDATMVELLDNAKRCSDLFGCPVGIEGQYPTKADDLMVSTWSEYREVFESGVPYVIDLSHINILAYQSKQKNETMLAEMLSCDRCLEVHLSDNDGTGDWHQVCKERPWWYDLLGFVHEEAVIFSEGNHLRSRKAV